MKRFSLYMEIVDADPRGPALHAYIKERIRGEMREGKPPLTFEECFPKWSLDKFREVYGYEFSEG